MNLDFRSAQAIQGAGDYASAHRAIAEQFSQGPVVESPAQTDASEPERPAITQTTQGYSVTQIPVDQLCSECRFGAGLPVGSRRLMRCVHPGELTAGQFLRGPLACEGFEGRPVVEKPAQRREVSGVGAAHRAAQEDRWDR